MGGRRRAVEEALRALDQPIAVVLDDIDRLTTSEIRDIFKLVRLTASFPNLIYFVVFDRARVERALDEDGLKGRAYLEKILQLVVDLPAIPEGVIQRQVLVAIDESLKGIENQGPFDESRWPDVFMEIVFPLLSNMRDIRRYAAAVHGTVCDLEGNISVVDVLALEAVRVFLPDTFGMFRRAISGLTYMTSGFGNDPPHLKIQIDALIQSADEHQEVVKSLVRRLFPAGERHLGGTHFSGSFQGRWLRDRRVAHEDLLRLYLERVAGESLNAFLDAEKAYALFDDERALEHYLRSLPPERIEDVVSQLEAYEDSFTEAQVIPAVAVLLNLLPDIPERQRGFFDLGARFVVGRVVYRLLKKLDDQTVAENAVRTVLPKLRSLSAKLELVSDVGYREGRGHKLISEGAAKDIEREWRAEVRQATAQELAREHEIHWVLLLAQREAEAEEALLAVPNSPDLTLAILRSARGETKSQSDGSRAIRRSYRLPWSTLIELYGSEETLRLRIEDARVLVPPTDDVIQLADKYLGGWRPSDHGED
ncbi:P-loop NTPase fold protein [uncultured Xanthomonas sp.]|uniref:P-loop NTPase fold protein n=1 Tax=uncultured Xanthomonas sp. TaxID=152831 RepID=UPI0025F82E96|nr:P-loop NTPase fold protein [uncultured Xanthomonas sp.]